jgi:predicted RNA-binding Zn-ribbon protein involved in translation (DUF1610 family)
LSICLVIVTNTKANTLIFGQPTTKTMAKKKAGTGTRKKTKARKTLNYSLQNTGTISRFIELVTYKAEQAGKRVIAIDESYTTQICPQCGKPEYKTLAKRFIVCSNCGYQQDRDLASAINILAKFYLQKTDFADVLLQEPSVNEESFFSLWKGFLRQTANGKTNVPLTSYWSRFGGLAGKIPALFSSI